MKKRTQLGLVMTSVAMALGSASVNAAELEITVPGQRCFGQQVQGNSWFSGHFDTPWPVGSR